jgi:hypothetical protein
MKKALIVVILLGLTAPPQLSKDTDGGFMRLRQELREQRGEQERFRKKLDQWEERIRRRLFEFQMYRRF